MSEEAEAPGTEGANPGSFAVRPLHLLRKSLPLLSLFLLLYLTLAFVPLPQIILLRWRDPSTTAFIRARQERLRAAGKSDAIDRRPVPLARVSPDLVAAVVAAEDARFWEHHGIDWEAVAEARAYNLKHAGGRRPRVHGASTITQQLAKNLWLSGRRTWWRKGREAGIALALDALVPKRRLLELYLSAIEWGERTYGCEAAARSLFGVPASRLDGGTSREDGRDDSVASLVSRASRGLGAPGRNRRQTRGPSGPGAGDRRGRGGHGPRARVESAR